MKKTIIPLSKELILSIRGEAKKKKMSFAQMIEEKYRFEPNICLALFEEKGKYYKKEKDKRIFFSKEEMELINILNPLGTLITIVHRSLVEIEDRIKN